MGVLSILLFRLILAADLTVGISYLEYPFQIECQGHPTNPWYGADVIIFAEVHRLEEQTHVECALMEAVLNIAIGDFPHMAVANEQIHQMYSVEFGTAYNNLITDGSLVLNSLDAAIGFGLLRDQLPQTQWIHVAQDLQNAFYQQGRSLSDVTLYEEVATKYGLDGGQIKTAFIEAQKTTTMHPDFKRAMELGAQSFPTFVLEKDGQYYDMRSQGDTVEAMENCLSRVTG